MEVEGPPKLYGGHVNRSLIIEDIFSRDADIKLHRDSHNAAVLGKAESLVVEEKVDNEDTAPDGGWGWVVAGAAFTTWVSLKKSKDR